MASQTVKWFAVLWSLAIINVFERLICGLIERMPPLGVPLGSRILIQDVLDGSLQKIDANRLLVLIREDSSAIPLDQGRFADGSIANDDHL